MGNKRKQKVRKLMGSLGRSYQACLNSFRRQHKSDDEPLDLKKAAQVLRGLSEANVRWVFRHEPALASMIVRNDVRRATRAQLDFLKDKIEELTLVEHLPEMLAETIIQQFDAYFAWSEWMSNPDLSSRALFDAGVAPMYFRFARKKIEACIGHLVSARNSVHLFQTELEPLLRHAKEMRRSEYIELLEVVPDLDLQLRSYLLSRGWCESTSWPESSGYRSNWAKAYCRCDVDGPPIPPRQLRKEFSAWSRRRRENVMDTAA